MGSKVGDTGARKPRLLYAAEGDTPPSAPTRLDREKWTSHAKGGGAGSHGRGVKGEDGGLWGGIRGILGGDDASLRRWNVLGCCTGDAVFFREGGKEGEEGSVEIGILLAN